MVYLRNSPNKIMIPWLQLQEGEEVRILDPFSSFLKKAHHLIQFNQIIDSFLNKSWKLTRNGCNINSSQQKQKHKDRRVS
ncbi:hypothetical protein Leryth_005359 [Lithospermum erythrorhizon]|nr:hypothetical protein Leryth_005359 [Lithospermum erythrorhizon]